MAVEWRKYIVKKNCKKCNGAFECIQGLPIQKGKIWKLASEHPIVQKFVRLKFLLKLNDQTKVAHNEPKKEKRKK